VFLLSIIITSGMDDLLLKRVLFECIRGSLERTDACLGIFTGRHAVMLLTYCYLYTGLCSFFTSPYARVLSAFGVITRFNKRLFMELLTEKTPRLLN